MASARCAHRRQVTQKIHPNVKLGANVHIGDFVVIGEPPKGAASGELETIIGDNATIRSHSVIYAGVTIGRDFQCGHGALIREHTTIGDAVSVGSHTVIEHRVRIDDRARVHSQAFIPEFSVLEAGSWVGPNVVFTNAPYPLGAGAKDSLVGPTLRAGAKVGANSTLLPGVTIGRDALVGAGTVVVRDVADGEVVVGNPARVVNRVDKIGAYAAARKPLT